MTEEAPLTKPSRAYVESDRVEGTAVHDPEGRPLGRIKRLVIEKASGRVAYVVIAFGGSDEDVHALPWARLRYDPGLGGYHADVTETQLREAPPFARQGEHDWTDHAGSDALDAFYSVPPHLRTV
jgi:hypothetical protein